MKMILPFVAGRPSQSRYLSRRSFIAGTAAVGGGAAIGCRRSTEAHTADEPVRASESFTLRHVPLRVFKALDPSKEGTESWHLNVVLEAPEPGPWGSRELEITERTGESVVGRATYQGALLGAIRTELPASASVAGTIYRPFTLRIRGTAPLSAQIDSIDVVLRLSGPAGEPLSVGVRIPFHPYAQKTALTFPFRGHGLVTQGGVNDGGHGNRSGQFAVDAIGLTPMYAPQLGEEEVNEATAGFGREIVAPGAGVVERVRDDRPDQPVPGNVDPEFLLPEYREGGDPGNHVVIDHENGEFSLIAHFQAGSLRVSAGQRVASGEPIGLLGNSGDSTFPHVHYQLMDGADWRACDALPYRFANIPARLFRGTWFEAKA